MMGIAKKAPLIKLVREREREREREFISWSSMIDVQSVSLGKFEPRGISLKRNQIKQFVLT
jgi:predicted nucleotidyltransferase